MLRSILLSKLRIICSIQTLRQLITENGFNSIRVLQLRFIGLTSIEIQIVIERDRHIEIHRENDTEMMINKE